MNRTDRLSRRAWFVLAGAAVVASGSPSATAGIDETPQQAAGIDERVPALVRKVIVDQLEVAEPKVIWNARFVEDLGADSLDTVELVMALEEAFKIEIRDEDAEKILRVGQLVEYLRAHKVLK